MVTTRTTPTESPASDGPPREVLVSAQADEQSIASAPTPGAVSQGFGARFRTTKPTPKKVVFDAVNWLANKTAAATATAAASNTNAFSSSNQQDNSYNRNSQPDEQGKGNEVDGSDSASGRKAPGHANTSVTDRIIRVIHISIVEVSLKSYIITDDAKFNLIRLECYGEL